VTRGQRVSLHAGRSFAAKIATWPGLSQSARICLVPPTPNRFPNYLLRSVEQNRFTNTTMMSHCWTRPFLHQMAGKCDKLGRMQGENRATMAQFRALRAPSVQPESLRGVVSRQMRSSTYLLSLSSGYDTCCILTPGFHMVFSGLHDGRQVPETNR
jgi:hypothetical protein